MKMDKEPFIISELELNSDNEEENIINKRPRTGKKERIIVDQHIKTVFDGTVWKISGSPKLGRTSVHSIFRNMSNYLYTFSNKLTIIYVKS